MKLRWKEVLVEVERNIGIGALLSIRKEKKLQYFVPASNGQETKRGNWLDVPTVDAETPDQD
jgi:hypothetical protein